jgi:hypothetical protein
MAPRRFVRRHIYRGGSLVIDAAKRYILDSNRRQRHPASAEPLRRALCASEAASSALLKEKAARA